MAAVTICNDFGAPKNKVKITYPTTNQDHIKIKILKWKNGQMNRTE